MVVVEADGFVVAPANVEVGRNGEDPGYGERSPESDSPEAGSFQAVVAEPVRDVVGPDQPGLGPGQKWLVVRGHAETVAQPQAPDLIVREELATDVDAPGFGAAASLFDQRR
jgi:hypothetical protein